MSSSESLWSMFVPVPAVTVTAAAGFVLVPCFTPGLCPAEHSCLLLEVTQTDPLPKPASSTTKVSPLLQNWLLAGFALLI